MGRRAGGAVSRWQAVERYLDESAPDVGTAIDIGSNNGFFVLKLAERGLVSVGIESFPPFVRIATYAMKRAQVGETGMDALDVNPRSASLVPPADVVVFLSVWHHMLREHGLEPATRILRTIWERTQHTLFFDTGENEMPPEFGLPRMAPSGEEWLTGFLGEQCPGGTVVHLGRHDAFDADGLPAARNLFAVSRG